MLFRSHSHLGLCEKHQKILFRRLIALIPSPVIPITHALFSTSLPFKSAADRTVQMRYFPVQHTRAFLESTACGFLEGN